ncbi:MULTISPECIES: gamma-butyrobetaine hydroxylase-like domain-containing protein [unclassified Bradyrhizobium]|uniref:gamma-butyrobetaine hydroxylase-like domain-containing protein n=1 Tax=Bradyrhizobium TaxID=374 RepID=UPI0028E909BE|nr:MULTISPECIES: gamma-butyrobetaine hydroxylase-like domain-containing protein [unclassified Bradyrhizobium]
MIPADTLNSEVSPDLASLRLRNAGGAPAELSAERLRLSCMCAHCRRARLDGRFPAQFPGIGIVGVGDLGYGLNIAFSDGHNRGIYPKSYLWELVAA